MHSLSDTATGLFRPRPDRVGSSGCLHTLDTPPRPASSPWLATYKHRILRAPIPATKRCCSCPRHPRQASYPRRPPSRRALSTANCIGSPISLDSTYHLTYLLRSPRVRSRALSTRYRAHTPVHIRNLHAVYASGAASDRAPEASRAAFNAHRRTRSRARVGRSVAVHDMRQAPCRVGRAGTRDLQVATHPARVDGRRAGAGVSPGRASASCDRRVGPGSGAA
ncbi:hypothetical protein C2E23DRAFT_189189 [Lenzites betulinus]|nr:hypothetical protein C2E23DRAFT_189189 [Lenzites betulinus]